VFTTDCSYCQGPKGVHIHLMFNVQLLNLKIWLFILKV